MRRNKRFALFAPVAVAALALSACGSDSPTTTPAPNASGSTGAAPSASGGAGAAVPVKANTGELTFGSDQEPTGFNVNTSKDAGTAAVNVTVQILPSVATGTPDLGFQFNKDLLVSDPTVVSTSPQVIEYKIKPEAKWSDGKDIDVSDFELQFKANNGTDDKFDVASTTGYEDMAKVEAVGGDKKTIRTTYKPGKSFPDWQGLFTNMVPAHLVNAAPEIHEAWANMFNTALPVSGGPWSLAEYKTGDSLTLTPNPMWYGAVKPSLQKIIFRFLPESTTQPQALQNKEVQLIYPQPQLDLVNQVKNIPGVESSLNFGLSFEHIDFNAKVPGLNDVAVRKAIALGLNVPAILDRTIKQFTDKAEPLGNRIWLTGQSQYEDHSGPYQKGDVEGAKKALDAAGYVPGADGIRAKGGTKLNFAFTTTEGNALRQSTFDIFQTQMKELGINITPDIRPSKVVFPDLSEKKFQIALFAWVGTPFPTTSSKSIYVTGGGQNYGSLDDPKVNKLFDTAFAELDPAKSAATVNEIDKQLWEDMVTIPLYSKPTFIAFDNTFGNVADNGTSDGPFWNSYTWGVKQQ